MRKGPGSASHRFALRRVRGTEADEQLPVSYRCESIEKLFVLC
jgi:hypothetical protein